MYHILPSSNAIPQHEPLPLWQMLCLCWPHPHPFSSLNLWCSAAPLHPPICSSFVPASHCLITDGPWTWVDERTADMFCAWFVNQDLGKGRSQSFSLTHTEFVRAARAGETTFQAAFFIHITCAQSPWASLDQHSSSRASARDLCLCWNSLTSYLVVGFLEVRNRNSQAS